MFSIPPELARSALDAAPDAMIIIDSAGVIRYGNRQVTALFGYSHAEVIGKQVEQLMPERYRPRDPDLRMASKPIKAEEFLGILRALLA
jgi:PAS domain S-box-containing protein